MLKKFPFDKINFTKNALFLFYCELQLTTLTTFTSNSQFLYKLNHMIRLSKTVCGNFHFRFCLVFIKTYIFVQQKAGKF